jgi:hypothetical protein
VSQYTVDDIVSRHLARTKREGAKKVKAFAEHLEGAVVLRADTAQA